MTGHPFTVESEVDVHIGEECIAVDCERLLPPANGEACHSTDQSWAPSDDTSVTPISPRSESPGARTTGKTFLRSLTGSTRWLTG